MITSRRLRLVKNVARLEEGWITLKILIDKPTGKRPSDRFRRRLEDNITMDVKEIGINKRNWVDSGHDTDYWRALVNPTFNLQVP